MGVTRERTQGWLAGAALYGVFGALIPTIAATPFGWVGALLGTLPAVLLPNCPLPRKWQRRVEVLRCVWSVPFLALTLGLCARGIANYSYSNWAVWVPALLLTVVGWRGSRLDGKGQERLGKLLVFLMFLMTLVLVLLVLPRLDFHLPRAEFSQSVTGALRVFLVTLAAASAVCPAAGRLPGLSTAVLGSAAGGICVGAEGWALAAKLSYPFLVLCDAAAFEMRLSSLGSAMWAMTQSALLVLLLSRLEGRWLRLLGAAGVFLLTFTLPWSERLVLLVLVSGAVLGYLPPVLGLICRRRSGKNYI